MIWNISEKLYDYEPFENMILEFKFPGYPSPPLNILVELMKSIKSWLSADPSNIAVVHCATGFVRTATVVACYLCYCGACDNTREAMSVYYEKRGMDENAVSIPSQIRYLDYTMKLFKGFDPKEKPLKLVCVIANGAPRLGEHSKPYLQIWKNNELQYSSRVKQCRGLTGKTESGGAMEEAMSFMTGDCILSGDILIRCRYNAFQTDKKGGAKKPVKESLFRVNFHTAFITSQLFRLTKRELDGPHNDSEFANDFFVDLVFAPESFEDHSVDPKVREALAVMDESEDAFMPGVGVKVASEKSIWEIARQDAKEGAEAKAEELEQKRPLEEGDIVKAYQASEEESSSPATEYVPFQPQAKRPSLEALEEDSMFLESSADIRKRAESRSLLQPPTPAALAKTVVKASVVEDNLDDEAMELALEMEIAAEGLETSPVSGSTGNSPKPLAAASASPAAASKAPPPEDGGFADELKAALESDDDDMDMEFETDAVPIDVPMTPAPVVDAKPSPVKPAAVVVSPPAAKPPAPAVPPLAAKTPEPTPAAAVESTEDEDEDELLRMMEGELAEEGFDLDNLDLGSDDDLDDLDNDDFLAELESELNAS